MQFLLTRFATVLCFNPATQGIRREPLAQAPRNVAFFTSPDNQASEATHGAGRVCVLDHDGGTTAWGWDVAWQSLPDGRIAMNFGGRISFDQGDVYADDAFWALTAAQLDGLAFVARHRWVSD